MFGTKNVEEPKFAKYIRPGIQEVEFVSLEFVGKFIGVNLKVVGEEDESSTNFRLYMNSEGSIGFNTTRIKQMGKAATNDESIDSVTGSTLEEYAEALNRFFKGKTVRMKFTGKEFQNRSTGNIGVWAELGVGKFVESTSIPKEKSELTFSEDKDIKKLEKDQSSSDFLNFDSDTNEDDGLPLE